MNSRTIVFFYILCLTVVWASTDYQVMESIMSGMVFLSPLVLSWLIAHKAITAYPIVSGVSALLLVMLLAQLFLQLPNASNPLLAAVLMGFILFTPVLFMVKTAFADIQEKLKGKQEQ